MNTWFRLRAARTTAELRLYDEIGARGITSKDLLAQLDTLGQITTLTVRINSPGGDVFDALAIHNALRRHPARVVAHIDALCASAATLIALAADEVRMADNALFMIHEPWTVSMGNSAELLKQSDLLDTTAEQIVGIYARKTGADPAEVRDWMRAETWYTAEQALAAGFIDAIDEPLKMAALISHDLSCFSNRPHQVPMMTQETPMPALGEPLMHSKEIPPAPPAPPVPVAARQPDPFDPVVVAKRCADQGEPGLIQRLLEQRAAPEQVETALHQAQEIRKLCAIARAPELADALVNSGSTPEQAARVILNTLAQRSDQQPVDNTSPERKTLNRATFDTLDPQARADFFRAGGRLID